MTRIERAEPTKPPQPWRRLASLAGARPGHAVCVAGPHSLDAMVALCRDGYERVECARQATCACADETCDVLLIDGDCDPDALAQLIFKTARLVRDGGVAAILLPRADARRQAPVWLARAGLQVIGSAHAAGGAMAAFTVTRAALRLAS